MQPPGLWPPFKAQVIRAGSQEITCKADLPRVVSAQKGMWVRIADPQRAELHLRPESRDALQWLLTCFAHDRRRTLRQKPLLHCFAAIAIGKLNIVLAEGRDPRLVLDSTVCNANTLCRIPEHVALPSAHEVMKSFQHSDAYGNWIALALDFKAAHKTIKVRPQEQGTLLFELDGALHHYTVCHFGAKFSAYWWSRLGALLTRTAHELLAEAPHRMWLYVDDLLTLLQKQQCTRPVCILLAFLTCINAPISWKKAQLSAEVVWCGWNFSFAFETLHLAPAKLAKLRNQLQTLCKSRKVQRKLLEATLGLLMWATSTCPHLRPYMAPLYRDLHSAAGTLKLIHPRLWQQTHEQMATS